MLGVAQVALPGASTWKFSTYHLMHVWAAQVHVVWSCLVWFGLGWVSGIPPSCLSCSLNIGTEIQLTFAVRLSFPVVKGSEV